MTISLFTDIDRRPT